MLENVHGSINPLSTLMNFVGSLSLKASSPISQLTSMPRSTLWSTIAGRCLITRIIVLLLAMDMSKLACREGVARRWRRRQFVVNACSNTTLNHSGSILITAMTTSPTVHPNRSCCFLNLRLCSLTYRDTDCYLRCYHRFVKRRQSFTSDNNTDEPVLT